MSYSDFTFAKLKRKYGINQMVANLFADIAIQAHSPSEHLKADLEEAKNTPIFSEKAKSEAIIAPLVREIRRNNPHITVFSGYSFNIDKDEDLNGVPDFMFSARPHIIEPQSPIFCLFESKNKSPEEGFAQCAAEMYAAKIFNQQMEEPFEIIYGAVTNAFDWVFLKLEGDSIYIDRERYYLNELPKLIGIMNWIVSQYKV